MESSSPNPLGRRKFLSDTFSVTSSFAIGGALADLGGRIAVGDQFRAAADLVPVRDETTGLPLLLLPEGFRYQSFGWTRDPMKDGSATPSSHDGMAVVEEKDGIVTLVRNHEVNGLENACRAPSPLMPKGEGAAPAFVSIPPRGNGSIPGPAFQAPSETALAG